MKKISNEKLLINVKKIFSLILLLVISFSVVGCSLFKEEPPKIQLIDSDILESLLDYKDKIKTSNLEIFNRYYNSNQESLTEYGSGTIFKKQQNKYFVATNYHVIENKGIGNQSLTIKTYDNEIHIPFVVAKNEELDLAILLFETINHYYVPQLDQTEHAVSSFVLAIGNVPNAKNLVTFGKVLAYSRLAVYNEPVIRHNAESYLGCSGGGLYNVHGKLIAINTWISESSSNFSIPIKLFNDLLNSTIN